MPISPSIADQLRQILTQVKADGGTEAEIVALLQSLGADLAFDESVTYALLQQVAQIEAAEQQQIAQILANQAAVTELLIAMQADIDLKLEEILDALVGPPPSTAVSVSLSLAPTFSGGSSVTTITVDTTNEVLVLTFVDDHGDTAAAPTAADGSAAVLTATSDTPTVATVGAFAVQADGTYHAAVTPVAVGSVNLGATVDDSTGAAIALPAPGPAGETTFNAEIGTVALTVDPGAAAGARLSLA